jgi:hypothetical protein
MAAADRLPVEKREVFLQRVAAWLRVQGYRFTDAEFENVVRIKRTEGIRWTF